MQKISLPTQLKGDRKEKKSKVKAVKSPYITKALLRVTRAGEIYIEADKIYLKMHGYKYPRLLAQVRSKGPFKVLYIKDRKTDSHGYKFNAYVIENTKYDTVLFEKDKEIFAIPVERIRSSGLYAKINTESPIDQTLFLPYVSMRMYRTDMQV